MRNLPCLAELRWWKERCPRTLEKATETWNLDTALIIILIIQLCGGHSTEHVQCERSIQDDVSIQPSLLIANTGSPYSFLVNHGLCKSFSGTVVPSWAAEHTYYCRVHYLCLTALGHSVCSFHYATLSFPASEVHKDTLWSSILAFPCDTEHEGFVFLHLRLTESLPAPSILLKMAGHLS